MKIARPDVDSSNVVATLGMETKVLTAEKWFPSFQQRHGATVLATLAESL